MSEVLVLIRHIRSYETEVFVDGKFAYRTSIHPFSIKENLEKLFGLMVIENVRIEVQSE